MNEQTQNKKGLPTWAIVVIILVILFVVGIIGIGAAFNYFFSGKRGENLAKQAAGAIIEKVVEKATDGKTDVKVNLDNGNPEVNIKSKEGDVAFAYKDGAELPKDFPQQEVPIFSPAAFKSYTNLGGVRSFTWETGKPAKEVAAFYQQKLNEKGWKMETNMQDENGYALSYKKDKLNLSLQTGTQDGSATQISIILMPNME